MTKFTELWSDYIKLNSVTDLFFSCLTTFSACQIQCVHGINSLTIIRFGTKLLRQHECRMNTAVTYIWKHEEGNEELYTQTEILTFLSDKTWMASKLPVDCYQ